MNKRGALDLSIQAIVIIVLAMTLLGLGLGFVRGLFGNISGISESTFQRISEQLSTDLATSNAPLIFSQSRMTMERGSSSLEGFGARNDGNTPIKYGLKFETFSCPIEARTAPADPKSPCTSTEEWFEYFKGDDQYDLKAAERRVNKLQINIPRTAKVGLYLLKISAYMGVWPAQGDCVGGVSGCTKIGQTELFLTVT